MMIEGELSSQAMNVMELTVSSSGHTALVA
jgi:hypothetical protein